MRVKLNKGDILYLPAFWYHHVSQTTDYHQSESKEEAEGEKKGVKATIAVNWWFDMKFEGSFWTGLELSRRLVKMLDGEGKEEEDGSEGGEEEVGNEAGVSESD